uniref:Gluconokinase n=1 Tax=Acrobeloides nanus TaxID=290746 RepID=A0A914C9D1_9BILA
MVEQKFIIIGGVTGCGKTTISKNLALKLGYESLDADDFHSAENVAKMAQAIPLTTEDRLPWLETLSRLPEKYPRLVLACSALKPEYRRILQSHFDAFFIMLNTKKEVIQDRLTRRLEHYASFELVESQFKTLEMPKEDEKNAAIVENVGPVDEVIDKIIKILQNA